MGNKPTYWLNNDSTGVTLHESGCVHVQKWAQPPKWVEFPTSEAARASTRRAIRECGDCMGRPGGGGCFVSRYEVVNGMAARVMSEIRENPESDWASASERIKREFACESETLYSQSQCDYADGSDLLKEAASQQAPQIKNDVIRGMQTALVSAVENAPRGMALWSQVRADILRKNNLAMEILRGLSLSPFVGPDLIDEALDGISSQVRVEVRDDVVPDHEVEYLVKATIEPPTPSKPSPPPEKVDGDVWPPPILRSLTWVHIIIGIVAALLALIGVTIWDFIPVPCDLWPFSLYSLPRCP